MNNQIRNAAYEYVCKNFHTVTPHYVAKSFNLSHSGAQTLFDLCAKRMTNAAVYSGRRLEASMLVALPAGHDISYGAIMTPFQHRLRKAQRCGS